MLFKFLIRVAGDHNEWHLGCFLSFLPHPPFVTDFHKSPLISGSLSWIKWLQSNELFHDNTSGSKVLIIYS